MSTKSFQKFTNLFSFIYNKLQKDNFTIVDSDITKRRMKYGWIQNYSRVT